MLSRFGKVNAIGNDGDRIFQAEVANFVVLLFAGRMNARGAANHFALEQSPDDALLEARKGKRRWRQHSPRRDDERLACKQRGAPGVHIGHEPEAVIMNHVSLRREFVQRARETRRAAQVPHHGNARPVPGKATAAIVVGRDVTPICPATESSRASPPAMASAWQSRGTV